ncbi:MAG: acyltransferase [Ferruginibacter sp.]|nr:acyltransferase [Ferruginibacter sp.]
MNKSGQTTGIIFTDDKQFIPALTGIRAIAVYFIFFKHLNFFSPETQPGLYLFVNQFYTFLTFFFVLSGFLIYYKYHGISTLNKTKLYNYFINRISRVFPILIILISITFFLGYYHGLYSGRQAIKLYFLNISLLKGFSSEYFLTGIGPSWSMSVEELFYLLSPLIFLFIKKISGLVKFVILFYMLGIAITYLFSLHPSGGFFSDHFFMMNYTFFGRVFEFACGIYLAMLVKGKVKPLFVPCGGKTILYAGLLIVALSVTALFFIAVNNNLRHATDILPGILINNLLMPVGIVFIFYSLIYQKSHLQQFLSGKLMVALGNSTYSFYLLHTSFMLSYIFKFTGRNILLAFILMIIISFIFYKTVEQPLAVLIRKKLSKK